MKTWKWAIFGPGKIARKFANGLRTLENVSLYAVASSTKERAEKFAEEYNIENIYGSYAEALEDDAIEICYIATLHGDHFPLAKQCLEAGKHVLIEKPICLNENELSQLIDLAKAKQCFIMEAMWTRFRPTTLQVKNWADNAIGDLLSVNCALSYNSDLDPNSRITRIELGASALLDMGVYGIAYINMLFEEEPQQVHYHANLIADNVDISGVISMLYKDHRLASIQLNVRHALDDNALILGTEGYIKVMDFHNPKAAELYRYTDRELREAKMLDSVDENLDINGYQYQAVHLMECLDEGLLESPIYPVQNSLDNLKIMDALRKDIHLVFPQETEVR